MFYDILGGKIRIPNIRKSFVFKKSERIFFVKMQKEVDAHHERPQNITFMLEVLCRIVWRCPTLVYI